MNQVGKSNKNKANKNMRITGLGGIMGMALAMQSQDRGLNPKWSFLMQRDDSVPVA